MQQVETHSGQMSQFALAQVKAVLALRDGYGVTLGRNQVSDLYLYERLRELEEAGDIANAGSTFEQFVQEGWFVDVFGEDQHWQEASYYAFNDEVETAVVNAGLWLDADTGEPVEPSRPVEDVHLPGDEPE